MKGENANRQPLVQNGPNPVTYGSQANGTVAQIPPQNANLPQAQYVPQQQVTQQVVMVPGSAAIVNPHAYVRCELLCCSALRWDKS